MGNNGLYVNCTFVGVTYIESDTACDDENWNYTGAVMAEPQFDPVTGDPIIDPITGEQQILYVPKFPDLLSEAGGGFVNDTRPFSNNVRFHNCTFLGSIAGDRLAEYTHWRNKVQMTGFTRFYLDPNDEELAAQPDAALLIAHLNGIDPLSRYELAKSSMLMPGWSVDVGNFDNEQAANPADTPVVKLRGTIIAGILDVRGTADMHGTVLMTFRPAEGMGPLFYGGQADAFNTTIGYFGPDDGDPEGTSPDDPEFNGFGEIRLRYDPDAVLPDGIPWPVRMLPIPETYVEGAV
jgi:hypothetical protein